MGFTRPSFRRALATIVTSALATGALIAVAPAAQAAVPAPIPNTALPTVQIDGVVWSQLVVDGVVYAGGDFQTARPAGAAAGTGVSRPYLLAYDVATGALVSSFQPALNGQVRGIAASADGSVIYVVGDFTTAGGAQHQRIAALNAATGAPVPGFSAQLNKTAVGITATSGTIWVGGSFTSANGLSRSRAAAFSAGSGAVTGWAPQVGDYSVRAVEVAPDRSKVLLAGSFTTVNGTAAKGMGAVSVTSGSSLPWKANTIVQDSGANSAIYSLSAKGGVVYGTGYSYTGSGGSGNLEGAVAMNWADGSVQWIENCNGDTYDSVPFDGALYTVSHAHDCSHIGGFTGTDPETYRRALGFSLDATRQIDSTSGWFVGMPAPTLLDWYPVLAPGSYTGLYQAAWSAAAGDGYLVLGGEFTKVNGVKQQGLVRFKGQPDSTDPIVSDPAPSPTPTPTSPTPAGPIVAKPNRVAHPDAVALGPTRVAVRWSAPKGAAGAGVTSYVIKAYKGSTVVKTIKVGASKRLAVITGLKKSTAYRIGVAARNASGTGKLASFDAAKTTGKGKNVSATKHPSKVKKPSTKGGVAKVKVHWKGASAKGALAITKYQIRIVKAGKVVKTVTVSAKIRTKTVVKLAKRTGYTVSVRAYNWAGWGSWSTARSVRTR